MSNISLDVLLFIGVEGGRRTAPLPLRAYFFRGGLLPRRGPDGMPGVLLGAFSICKMSLLMKSWKKACVGPGRTSRTSDEIDLEVKRRLPLAV
jgi:hypothetical protein